MTPSPSSSTSRTADSPLGTATCGAAVSRTSRPCPAAVVDRPHRYGTGGGCELHLPHSGRQPQRPRARPAQSQAT